MDEPNPPRGGFSQLSPLGRVLLIIAVLFVVVAVAYGLGRVFGWTLFQVGGEI